MAVYDLEEQEQLAELKTWWDQHGNLITAVVVVVALGVSGWQGWNWWQRNQAANAGAVYGGLQQAAAMKDARRARELEGELIDKYGRTTYAAMGALLAAKVQAEAGDVKNARAELAWAAENASDDALRDLARLRLAGVMVDDKAPDEALKQLAADPLPSFAPRFAEMKGDILASQGKTADAKAAYEAALAKLDAADKDAGSQGPDPRQSGYRAVLKAKLDSVGGSAK